MNVTPEQKRALEAVVAWLKTGRKPVFTLGGYAGTGKTTLIGILRRLIAKAKPEARVAFCAYTGKASRVLAASIKRAGVDSQKDSISTIHALIYSPVADKGGQIKGWKLKSGLPFDLVIVDEASMVDGDILQDLVSFGKPVLAVGDHGQLPPIQSRFYLMEKPDFALETIHRQAQGNPIIAVSIRAREDGVIPVERFGGGVVKLDKKEAETGEVVEQMLRGFNHELMILTGFNASRQRLNAAIRQFKDIEGEKPRRGERVICLKNNWEKGIYNGMMGEVQRLIPVEDGGKVHWYEAEIAMEDETVYSGKISAYQFGAKQTLLEAEGLKYKALGDLFDFGYALTVHKAQGSQAPKVLLFEERSQHMDDEEWRRWLYTGVTRAEEELTIVGV